MAIPIRQYAILNMITEERFLELKSEGIVQSSFTTCIKSKDLSKILIKWEEPSEPSFSEGEIIYQGSLSEIHSYLETNKADWVE